ncbi:DUF6507 family protein [Myceligenerans indicum]|uniref:Uncharacterized protein n=1 Tax=Myceligenerans indicum TaxID=2593663 RepID=A0ABS1LP46_9MICO|nr:DUF6507 family protein [Myceligenerans indicum]MBL0887948.1 hypothetical protein [Myceligenerans indicum]
MHGGEGWGLDPEAIRRVLVNAQNAGEDLAEALREPAVHVEAAVEGAAGAEPVADALAGFLENRTATLRGMTERVQDGITGAGTALRVYLQGDEEMAAEQRVAAGETASGVSTPRGGRASFERGQ